MNLLNPFINPVFKPTTLQLNKYEVLIILWGHLKTTEHTEFIRLHFLSPLSVFLTVCLHCCFSFSKTKLICFLGALSTGAWCCGEIWSSLEAEDFGSTWPVWAEAAGTDESWRTGLGLKEHTAKRSEATMSSRPTKSESSHHRCQGQRSRGKERQGTMRWYVYSQPVDFSKFWKLEWKQE